MGKVAKTRQLLMQIGVFITLIVGGYRLVVVITGLVTCALILSSPNFARLFFTMAQSIPYQKLRTRLQDIQESWIVMYSYVWNEKLLLIKITSLSILIWLLHLIQIWFFIIALRPWVPLLTNLALAPLAILAGILPMTFAGIGTRDVALIELYHPFFSKPTAIALGILCTARYLLPAIAGLPFLSNYLSLIKVIKND